MESRWKDTFARGSKENNFWVELGIKAFLLVADG
jgi:hypothetical protein